MSALALLLPLLLLIPIVAAIGLPSDFEAMAGASGVAMIACLWVATVFARRRWMMRHLPNVRESDLLTAKMLVAMSVGAVCVSWLLFYRMGWALSNSLGSSEWQRWFVENRLIGVTITLAIAASMISKISYPLSRALGRRWMVAILYGGVAVFLAIAYAPRLF